MKTTLLTLSTLLLAALLPPSAIANDDDGSGGGPVIVPCNDSGPDVALGGDTIYISNWATKAQAEAAALAMTAEDLLDLYMLILSDYACESCSNPDQCVGSPNGSAGGVTPCYGQDLVTLRWWVFLEFPAVYDIHLECSPCPL